MTRRPPRSTRTDTLFPYTTLFRSAQSPASLRGVVGKDSPVAVLLSAARSATLESMRSEVAGRAVSPADPKLIRYLQASMGALPPEILRALFLDGSRRVIGDEQMQHGRSEASVVGKEGVWTFRSRWSPYH